MRVKQEAHSRKGSRQVRPEPVNVSAGDVQEFACEPERLPVSGFEHTQHSGAVKRDHHSPRSGATTVCAQSRKLTIGRGKTAFESSSDAPPTLINGIKLQSMLPLLHLSVNSTRWCWQRGLVKRVWCCGGRGKIVYNRSIPETFPIRDRPVDLGLLRRDQKCLPVA